MFEDDKQSHLCCTYKVFLLEQECLHTLSWNVVFFHVLPHCVINVLISVMILAYYFIYLYLIHFNLCIPLYRKTLYVQHKCDTIFQVFSFKNNTKAQMRDIEAAYFVRTNSIHPISESLKIKVGASYRLRMDGNNNTDIRNNLYVMGNVFKITNICMGVFCLPFRDTWFHRLFCVVLCRPLFCLFVLFNWWMFCLTFDLLRNEERIA
jgi:hypothetical protein